jgi:hypothetical protein
VKRSMLVTKWPTRSDPMLLVSTKRGREETARSPKLCEPLTPAACAGADSCMPILSNCGSDDDSERGLARPILGDRR